MVHPPIPERQKSPHELRVLRIMRMYKCSWEDAETFISYREEGYSMHVAALKAGITDPTEEEPS